MFRPMRRKDKLMADEEVSDLLRNQSYGLLSVMGDGGYPYGVPLNYVYWEDSIIFHSALAGHKIDALVSHPKVSFTVVGNQQVLPGALSTRYESVVVFGEAKILEGEKKRRALLALGEYFAPEFKDIVRRAVAKELNITQMIQIEIHHMTGKKAVD